MKAKQIILFIIITIALTACGKSAFEQFNEALAVGELSKAQEYLVEVSDRTELKQGHYNSYGPISVWEKWIRLLRFMRMLHLGTKAGALW